jgi:hypothetical protein
MWKVLYWWPSLRCISCAPYERGIGLIFKGREQRGTCQAQPCRPQHSRRDRPSDAIFGQQTARTLSDDTIISGGKFPSLVGTLGPGLLDRRLEPIPRGDDPPAQVNRLSSSLSHSIFSTESRP